MIVVMMALGCGYLGWRLRTVALFLMARRSPFFSVKRDFYKAMGEGELAVLCEVADKQHRKLYAFSLLEVVKERGLPQSLLEVDLFLEDAEVGFNEMLARARTNGKRI